MTRVDFYILQSHSDEARYDFCCRLIEKAQRQGNKVLVYTGHQDEAKQLDELLWRYKPESYLPHALVGSHDAENIQLPILIAINDIPIHHQDVLINLSGDIPEDFARFKRFAQIVNQAPIRLEASRRHFAFFKKRGYPIEINKLNR